MGLDTRFNLPYIIPIKLAQRVNPESIMYKPFPFDVIQRDDPQLQPSFQYCDPDEGPMEFEDTDSFMNFLNGERNFLVSCVKHLDQQMRDMDAQRRENVDRLVRLTATLDAVSLHL